MPSITESLFDLNVGHHLVGRTEYCIYPEGKVDSIPTLGGTKNPDIQRIIALNPDLVFMNAEENRKEDAEALHEAGIAVWASMPTKVAEVFTLLWNIMELFEETDAVVRVRIIEQVYDHLMAMLMDAELPSVFVPIWYDPLMTVNSETYMHDLLNVCGANNVFAERERQFPLSADLGDTEPDAKRAVGRDTRYPRISLAEVEAAQPDVILLPSEPFAFTAEHIPIFKALDVPAAKHDRIHLVDGSWLTWHGTHLAYALNGLPKLLQVT
ncbi:MAG: helical backbone metal receptor [Chloroflexota bacterium]